MSSSDRGQAALSEMIRALSMAPPDVTAKVIKQVNLILKSEDGDDEQQDKNQALLEKISSSSNRDDELSDEQTQKIFKLVERLNLAPGANINLSVVDSMNVNAELLGDLFVGQAEDHLEYLSRLFTDDDGKPMTVDDLKDVQITGLVLEGLKMFLKDVNVDGSRVKIPDETTQVSGEDED